MDRKTDWRIERGLEILLLLLLAAAAFGLLGRPSPVIKTFTGSGLRMKVEYKPVSRLGLGEDLQVEISSADKSPGNEIEVQLNEEYLKGFNLERVTPQPRSEASRDGNLVFAFEKPDDGSEFSVKIELTSKKAGLHHGRLQASLGGATQLAAADFATRVWP